MSQDRVASLEAEIRLAEGDLARDLDTLAQHLPRRDAIVRLASLVVGATVTAWVGLWLLGRRWRRRREDRRLARIVRRAVEEAGS